MEGEETLKERGGQKGDNAVWEEYSARYLRKRTLIISVELGLYMEGATRCRVVVSLFTRLAEMAGSLRSSVKSLIFNCLLP